MGRDAFGDFQTPPALAAAVCARLAGTIGPMPGSKTRRSNAKTPQTPRRSSGPELVPATIVEPTCGRGGFLVAAHAAFPSASYIEGADINASHLAAARRALKVQVSYEAVESRIVSPGFDARRGARASSESRASSRLRESSGSKTRLASNAGPGSGRRAAFPPRVTLVREDVFAGAWRERLAQATEPVLVVGNPPWVTSADLGVLGSANRPRTRLATGTSAGRSFDAVTGRSNFDVSEWLLRELLRELDGRDYTLAMLVKTAVARRVLATAWRDGRRVSAELCAIDARAHFGVSVDACLLIVRPGAPTAKVFASLEARRPTRTMAFRDGALVADARAYAAAQHLRGDGPAWRSGIKHDCAAVMEVDLDVPLERAYPLLKGADLMRDQLVPRRALVVSQHTIGEDTAALANDAPQTWRYLTRHRAKLARRKSRIYEGRPAFSIFGVGPYTFAPWKVAVAALAKTLAFRVVGPHAGRPVVFDDTCYFLPFPSERAARSAARRLERARPLFESLVFWDAKRPITAELLRVVALR
jgi:hypothetical protein